jgi:putative transposase
VIINYIERKINEVIRQRVACLESRFKQWTQPAKRNQVMSSVADLKRSKGELIAENIFLRQQLIVLERQVERPKLTQRDRQILVLLASRIAGWRDALVVVKPDTLVGWHREGFRLYWRRRPGGKKGRPPISAEVIALIEEMAAKNRTLGLVVHADTVKKYMSRAHQGLPPRNQGQTWATFIKNHAGEMWACDFLQTYDLFFRAVFVYFIVELGSRRIVKYGVTRSPSDFWVAQQVRDATPYEEGPRFLIRDNDGKYGQCFNRVAKDRGIDVLRTPVRSPKANAICERFIGGVRRECLDHMLILNERHLQRVIGEYVDYFSGARPHQGIGQRIPDPREDDPDRVGERNGHIVGLPVLGGLHHDYRWVA